jgi:hypothetical protein
MKKGFISFAIASDSSGYYLVATSLTGGLYISEGYLNTSFITSVTSPSDFHYLAATVSFEKIYLSTGYGTDLEIIIHPDHLSLIG